MRNKHKTLATLALLLALTPAQAGGARLEGYVVNPDGRGAPGFRVHLIDSLGLDVAQAGTSDKGVYRFRDLPAGAYSLGIESPEGKMAPVAAPPTRLGDNELARRDIKLVEANQAERDAVGKKNFSFGIFWAGLSPAAKAASVIGIVVVLGLTLAALDDDDSSASNN